MVALEEQNERLDANSTGGSVLVPTALSLVLLFAQYSFSPIEFELSRIESHRTEATGSRIASVAIGPMELFKQINRVYDDLLKSQIELDTDAKKVLYSNLWDLYT